ncbi:MAG: pilus assembly protein [Frankiales bacterium]|nr:pilus assembly protein [Frankiales bacterium]
MSATPRDSGSALVEVLVLGVGLLVPLLHTVVSLMAVQSASFAATSAAREGARAYVTSATPAQAVARSRAAVALVLADAGVEPVLPSVRCVGGCLQPASRVDVTVRVEVPLPLLPGGPTVGVTGQESMPVDAYREVP